MISKQCKGCARHHNAGHPKCSPLYGSKYNDWCTRYGMPAKKALGHCKLNNGKVEK